MNEDKKIVVPIWNILFGIVPQEIVNNNEKNQDNERLQENKRD